MSARPKYAWEGVPVTTMPGVTSVGLVMPASTYNVTGSPVTGAGNLTANFINQAAKTFLAGPVTGAANVPTWRQPATTDLSDLVPATAWTPTVSCATPGDLSVSYALQTGYYAKLGPLSLVSFRLQFTPTYTSASGALQIQGLPITSSAPANSTFAGNLYQAASFSWGSATSLFCNNISPNAYLGIHGIGASSNTTIIQISALASAGTFFLIGSIVIV